MSKIALISCTNGKKTGFNLVKDIDKESQLFKLSMDYGKKIADEVYILTSRYGLVKERDYTMSYNESTSFTSEMENRLWSLGVLKKLNNFTNIHEDEYIILSDKSYYKNYVELLNKVDMPLGHLSVEEKINFLREELNEEDRGKISYGEKLHILFNSMKRYNHNNFDEIPFTNGIYIVLDKKEKYNDMDRIVRIGTHDKDNKLIVRIKNHYKNGFKDSSFFRKNIGKSILSYNEHYYSYIWNINFNDKINESKYAQLRDMEVESILEEKISNYMKERFEFVCFEVEELKERYRLEEGLISTIYHDNEFDSSDNWLGKYSPMDEIRDSKMWISKGFDNAKLNESEFRKVITLCVKSNEKKEEFSQV
ncbi:DUF6884 domain-containing protein [Terrisporobacter mayombei]|uniref:GIY-YIG domain-containing protein n=1 Tax=Terrisporobacter mayombei TaxID=1541 RepID=A0ABY9Q8F7_9FIRM|nr:DUF6884 domain-containing protein [Terrisporobacter mayombei]MCC3869571.1 hypothetical protein [Terrisporobacter mayombei]WMT83490.1 hypothetical protein TEMA_40080 [Terrisporobacter mayombei]